MDPIEQFLLDYDWRMDLMDHLQQCINKKEREIGSLWASIDGRLLKGKKKSLANEEVMHLEKRVEKMTERMEVLQVDIDGLAEEYRRKDVKEVCVNCASSAARAYKLSKDLGVDIVMSYGGAATDAELENLKSYREGSGVTILGLGESIKRKGN